MKFFKKVKGKLRTRNIVAGLACIVAAVLLGLFVYHTGFNSDKDYQIGLRGMRSGIPLPNWLVSGAMSLLGIYALSSGLSMLKEAFKGTKYQKMMDKLNGFSDAEAAADYIALMEKCPLASGDLRFDENLLFYLKGLKVNLILAEEIDAIEGEAGGKDGYFVNVKTKDGELIKLQTNQKNEDELLLKVRSAYGK